VGRLAWLLQLAPQPPHVNIHAFVIAVVVRPPDLLDQLIAAESPARLKHEAFQKPKLPRRERHLIAIETDAALIAKQLNGSGSQNNTGLIFV
jgi:hypothetical protein